MPESMPVRPPPSVPGHPAAGDAGRLSCRRRWLRRVSVLTGVVLGGGVVLALLAFGRVRASLPQLEGSRPLAGLVAEVVVERDRLGVPTVRGESRLDVSRALGFLHAQDRFFQMDLLRRRSAGELSAFVGVAAAEVDRETRVHRFRQRAELGVEQLSQPHRQLLTAYTEGVNAGLKALGAVPPEYLALQVQPQPWREADSLLAGYAMFLDLQNESGGHESARGLMHDLLPADLMAFLVPAGSPLDAPLEGPALETPPPPTPQVVDLRVKQPMTRLFAQPSPPPATVLDSLRDAFAPREVVYGSNNWAVAGSHTADGRALLAGDMHLRLGLPSIWYRAALVWPSSDGPRRIVGVTLPGAPCVLAGSTGQIAWTFTNSEGDWADLVVLETDPDNPQRYRTPDGWATLTRHSETIEIAGGEPEKLDVLETIWGPVIDTDHAGRPRAIRWAAHDPAAVNLGLLQLEEVAGVDEAIAVAGEMGVPAQNFVCVDAAGRVGWTIIGRIPRRVGFDGRVPVSWADGTARWDGWISGDERPKVVDPAAGRLWSANARVVPASGHGLIGDEGQDVGGRQGQIRDALLQIEKATADDMLAVQLDDRAVFLSRWRELLLELLTPEAMAADPRLGEARRLVNDWGGKAAVDSAGYRIVREWRQSVASASLRPLVAELEDADPRFDYLRDFRRFETPLWTLVTQRPRHLLDPGHESWERLMLKAFNLTLVRLASQGPLEDRTWGEWNVSRVQHPLGAALPFLSAWLDAPPRSLPGDANMPRVQLPWAGASQRMVVSPGREDEGFFHMPGGQSGHPLSPHYRDGHEAWASGKPTPFLPSEPVHTLLLLPVAGGTASRPTDPAADAHALRARREPRG